jgi:hypothetical protein
MFLVLGHSGQIDERVVTLTKLGNRLAEGGIEMRTEDARTGEIVF